MPAFMATEPLHGKCQVKVTERQTAVDFAEVVRGLVVDWHAEANKIVLAMDNRGGSWITAVVLTWYTSWNNRAASRPRRFFRSSVCRSARQRPTALHYEACDGGVGESLGQPRDAPSDR
jgi:hypothetical protein